MKITIDNEREPVIINYLRQQGHMRISIDNDREPVIFNYFPSYI